MITLLKGLQCYCPKPMGKKDILITEDKIFKIGEPGQMDDLHLVHTTLPCDGMLAFPGIIDQHVHIVGGGGEDGFASRIPEIKDTDILMAGVTTLVGLLGADNQTKGLYSLLAKARALESQGLTTFIYTGSYSIPTITFTNNITSDMVLIDKVIGTGEIAISDHRSSHPELRDMLKIATQTHLGGMISKKAGVVHIHVGDGKQGLRLLLDLTEKSDLPINMFVPTHSNRNKDLFQQAMEYNKSGGSIDLTAGETIGIPIPDAIQICIDTGVDLNRVTISSDANGNIGNGKVGNIQTLYDDVIQCIIQKGFPPAIAFSFVTENVAKVLKIYPQKGSIQEGSDADILITDKHFRLQKLVCKGQIKVDHATVL